MKVALVDDHLLGAVLRGTPPRALRRRSIATTGHWYVRLCQAVLRADDRSGSLSRPFAALPTPLRSRAVSSVLRLPPEITLVSLRELAPTIGRLRADHELDILGMEALAAAEHLDADVFLSASSPRLEACLAIEGRRWRAVEG